MKNAPEPELDSSDTSADKILTILGVMCLVLGGQGWAFVFAAPAAAIGTGVYVVVFIFREVFLRSQLDQDFKKVWRVVRRFLSGLIKNFIRFLGFATALVYVAEKMPESTSIFIAASIMVFVLQVENETVTAMRVKDIALRQRFLTITRTLLIPLPVIIWFFVQRNDL